VTGFHAHSGLSREPSCPRWRDSVPVRWLTSISTAPERTETSPRRSDFETDAITSLFPRVVAATVLLLVVLVYIRGTSGSKTWDKAAFVSSVLAAIYLANRFLRRSRSAPSRLALLLGFGGILWGVSRIEIHSMTAEFWDGFGTSVALVALPLAILIVPLSNHIRRSRVVSYVLTVPALTLVAFDLVSLIRNLSDFAVPSNNIFVLNEVLAPAAGRVPDAGFIPQYTTLFGWALVPFRHLLSAYALASMAVITLSCMSIAAVVLAIILGRSCMPERSLWLAAALTVPLTTVTAFHSAVDSSIGSYLQDLPVRMFPAMLYSLLAVSSLVALLRHSLRKVSIVCLGLLAGLLAWNSQDFGIAVAVAYGVVLQIAARGPLRKPATLLWLGGFLPGLILYPLWTIAIGHPVRFKDLALTARSFSGGFASSPIQIPGPVLFVLPVILGSVAVGGCLLWRAASGSIKLPGFQERAIVTLAFVGAWSTAGFVYYLNRSYASGQLQIFLLPVGVCLCALLSLAQGVMPLRKTRLSSTRAAHLKGRQRTHLKSRGIWLLPLTLPVAVGFAAMLQSPNPSISLDALRHPDSSIGFLGTAPVQEVSRAVTYARTHGGGELGYYGADANFLELTTGVVPRILFDDPSDFLLSNAADQLGCDYLVDDPTRWLVVVPGTVNLLGKNICGYYKSLSVPGEAPDTFFRLKEHPSFDVPRL